MIGRQTKPPECLPHDTRTGRCAGTVEELVSMSGWMIGLRISVSRSTATANGRHQVARGDGRCFDLA